MSKQRFIYAFSLFLILSFALCLLLFSSAAFEAVGYGLYLCAHSVIPSLFPFFVCAKLIANLKITEVVGRMCKNIMKPFFSLSGNCATPLILGMISGYPIGAATCVDMYSKGSITRREAERLLAFCNNSGPAFILGAMGTGVFGSLKIGFSLFGIHILSALLVGVIFRIASPMNIQSQKIFKKNSIPSFSSAFTDAVFSSLMSSMTISAYIIFFTVITSILKEIDIFRFFNLKEATKLLSEGVLTGIFEITSGAYKVYDAASPEISFVLIAFFLGFGGLSVHCQTLSCISGTELSTREYFAGKLLHAVLSAIFAIIVCKTNLFEGVEVFSNLIESPGRNSLSLFLPVVLLPLIYIFFKKDWKKT